MKLFKKLKFAPSPSNYGSPEEAITETIERLELVMRDIMSLSNIGKFKAEIHKSPTGYILITEIEEKKWDIPPEGYFLFDEEKPN